MRYDGLTRFLFRLITSLPLLASAAAALLCAGSGFDFFSGKLTESSASARPVHQTYHGT